MLEKRAAPGRRVKAKKESSGEDAVTKKQTEGEKTEKTKTTKTNTAKEKKV